MSEGTTTAQRAPKTRRPQARSLETKQKILEAAAREFATKGFEGASTRSIALAAGAKHPLVTYHYQTKAGLWRAVLLHLNELYDKRFNDRLKGLRGVDDVTTLRLLLEEFIYFSGDHPEFHWLMSEASREKSERLEWLAKESIQDRILKTTRLIDIAQQQGRFVPGDPAHLFYVFVGAVTRIFMVSAEMEVITGRSVNDPGFLERHAQICLSLFFRDPPARV